MGSSATRRRKSAAWAAMRAQSSPRSPLPPSRPSRQAPSYFRTPTRFIELHSAGRTAMTKQRSGSIHSAERGVAPIWSRPVVVEHIPESGLEMHIDADEKERAALAALDGLVGIS